MNYSYGHYYDFSKYPYLSEMNEVFSRIFDRSIKYYLQKPDGYNQEFAFKKIVEFVRDLEKSLIGLINLGYVTTKNVNHIKSIYKSLDTVGLLETSYRGGIYGISMGNRIEINPHLSGSRTLTNEERTLLYVCHEMGHRFHEEWKNPSFINEILRNPKVKERHDRLPDNIKKYVYYGSRLLDEALTQDRAEEITYYFAGKQRPALQTRSSRLFNGQIFKTNFDYYGEFQGITKKFGKGLYKRCADKDILKELSKAALDTDFMDRIVKIYKNNNNILDLYGLLHSMGIIKEASYEAFGMGTKGSIEKSGPALELINLITEGDTTDERKIQPVTHGNGSMKKLPGNPPPLPKFRRNNQ